MFDNSTPVRSKQTLKDYRKLRKITNKGNREKLVFNQEPEAEGQPMTKRTRKLLRLLKYCRKLY